MLYHRLKIICHLLHGLKKTIRQLQILRHETLQTEGFAPTAVAVWEGIKAWEEGHTTKSLLLSPENLQFLGHFEATNHAASSAGTPSEPVRQRLRNSNTRSGAVSVRFQSCTIALRSGDYA